MQLSGALRLFPKTRLPPGEWESSFVLSTAVFWINGDSAQ